MSAAGRGSVLSATVVVASLVLATGAATGGARADAGPRRPVATLRVGDSAFWTGTADPGSNDEDPLPIPIPSLLGEERSDCGSDCFYPLEIAGRGARLRVAIDTPDCNETVTLELVDPSGAVRDQDGSCYSAEVYARSPVKGTWTVRATASGPTPIFRMRAKLEGVPAPSGEKRRLLPNLRVEPPHQLGFHSGGLGVASESCYEEEVLEDGAVRCLRFAVGPQNVGAGPLELKFARDPRVRTDASMQQRIYYSDGSTEMRDAGDSEFHKAHQHFHLKGFAKFALFRVTDRARGKLTRAGTGNKAGFCLVDLRIARWRRFDQQRSYSARSNCMPVGGEAELGLSAGWTDVYGPELSGNYIDFGDNRDGFYVIRTIVDSHGYILESNERDNVGYAYIEVRGDSVKLLERGRGKSPWDPKKVVFDEWWRAAA